MHWNNDPIINVFIVACGLMIFFICWGAIVGTSTKRNKKIATLNSKASKAKRELAEVTVNQFILLNRLAKKGEISHSYYSSQYVILMQQFKDTGIDISALNSIPYGSFPDKKELIYKVLNISNELYSIGEIDESEYEKNINFGLDEFNK